MNKNKSLVFAIDGEEADQDKWGSNLNWNYKLLNIYVGVYGLITEIECEQMETSTLQSFNGDK